MKGNKLKMEEDKQKAINEITAQPNYTKYYILGALILIVLVLVLYYTMTGQPTEQEQYILECWKSTNLSAYNACNYLNDAMLN